MTEKDFRKLSREDLLELLVGQNREAEKLDQEIIILTDQLKRLKTDFDKTETLYNTLARYNINLPNRNIDAVRQELIAVIRKCQSGEVRAEFEKRVTGLSNTELFTGNRAYEEIEGGSVIAEEIMDMAAGLAEKIGDVTRGDAGSGNGKTIVSDSGKNEDIEGAVRVASDRELIGKLAGKSVISDEFEEDDIEMDNVSEKNSSDSHDDGFWRNFHVESDISDDGEQYDTSDMMSNIEESHDSMDVISNDTDDPEYGLESDDISINSEYKKRPKKSEAKMSRVEEALAWARMQFGGKK